MTSVAAHDVPVDGRGRSAAGWWGMVLAVVTEASLFLNLLFSYFYVAVQSSGWPPDGPPELKLALPNTILLLASSLTMWWGERGIRRGRRAQLLLGALATFVLGTAFIAIQAIEYENHRFTPQTDVYGSLFFTICRDTSALLARHHVMKS